LAGSTSAGIENTPVLLADHAGVNWPRQATTTLERGLRRRKRVIERAAQMTSTDQRIKGSENRRSGECS